LLAVPQPSLGPRPDRPKGVVAEVGERRLELQALRLELFGRRRARDLDDRIERERGAAFAARWFGVPVRGLGEGTRSRQKAATCRHPQHRPSIESDASWARHENVSPGNMEVPQR
jgi:hypothetical protein